MGRKKGIISMIHLRKNKHISRYKQKKSTNCELFSPILSWQTSKQTDYKQIIMFYQSYLEFCVVFSAFFLDTVWRWNYIIFAYIGWSGIGYGCSYILENFILRKLFIKDGNGKELSKEFRYNKFTKDRNINILCRNDMSMKSWWRICDK